jgi:hypothetical protein
MRKGQIKLIERAIKYGYDNSRIELLRNEKLTIKQLENIFYTLWECHKMPFEWIMALLSVKDETIVTFLKEVQTEIPLSLITENVKEDDIAQYFSSEAFPCKSIFDVRLKFCLKDKRFATDIFKFMTALHSKLCDDWYCIRLASNIADATRYFKDSDIEPFLNYLCDEFEEDPFYYTENQIFELAKQYVECNLPFTLTSSMGIPDSIKALTNSGYDMNIYHHGYLRDVHTELKGIFISYVSYSGVYINSQGRISPTRVINTEKKIIFFYDTSKFVEGHKSKNGYIYTAVYLRDLYGALSVGDSQSDINSANSLIDYLCKRYKTKLFRDLYHDYQESKGMLLPLSIEDVAQYHSKQELFEKHYKMPLNGNWNKKNVNLTYLLLKLRSRMTESAIARAMQCKASPQVERIGKRRSKLVYILHKALYSCDYNENNRILIQDALLEEYQAKKIKLLPVNMTINEHNERNRINSVRNRRKANVKINENSKFKFLIENMPDNYELISNEERLRDEADKQHNCVYGYANSITNDRCMIYSTVYDNERHTIEVTYENGKYKIRQCYRACNQTANLLLVKQLRQDIKAVNSLNANKAS